MTPQQGEVVVAILRDRDGQLTLADLADGRQCQVFNIAWGRDIGAEFHHLTTNISPSVDGQPIDFFHTDQVVRLIDPVSREVLIEARPAGHRVGRVVLVTVAALAIVLAVAFALWGGPCIGCVFPEPTPSVSPPR